jgi:hypothetical protein
MNYDKSNIPLMRMGDIRKTLKRTFKVRPGRKIKLKARVRDDGNSTRIIYHTATVIKIISLCGTITAGKRAIHLSRIHKTISDAPWCRRGIRNRRNTEVNRDLLEQYTDAVKLIKETKETIKKLEKRNSVQTKDTVSGSNSEFPFQPMHFVIQGKTHDEDDKIERQKRRQQIQIEQAEKLKNDVEEWMLTIPFRMRRIIKFKIFEEMNWQQVAKHIGGKATGESVRKEFETFMKK